MDFKKISSNMTISEVDIIRKFDRYLAKHGISDDNITMENVVDFAEDCVVCSPVVEKLMNIYVGLVVRNYIIKD